MPVPRCDAAADLLTKQESITRLELERRALREACKDAEHMLGLLDQHLVFVESAKEEWVKRREQHEAERTRMMQEELLTRHVIEDDAASALGRLLMDVLPRLRALRSPPSMPQLSRHRR